MAAGMAAVVRMAVGVAAAGMAAVEMVAAGMVAAGMVAAEMAVGSGASSLLADRLSWAIWWAATVELYCRRRRG